jgi:hypothetical protein
MFTHLKIYTAIVICTVFVFRLLFVNMGIISSLNAQQNSILAKSHFSTILKRSKHSDISNNSTKNENSFPEICERNPSGEEDSVKENSPAILSFFQSLLTRITFIPKSSFLFDLIKCDLYPKKYLALSILRI